LLIVKAYQKFVFNVPKNKNNLSNSILKFKNIMISLLIDNLFFTLYHFKPQSRNN
jgi:hypothetical protein